ncbi:RAP domain-containing protein, partial [Baffinella frigidus]
MSPLNLRQVHQFLLTCHLLNLRISAPRNGEPSRHEATPPSGAREAMLDDAGYDCFSGTPLAALARECHEAFTNGSLHEAAPSRLQQEVAVGVRTLLARSGGTREWHIEEEAIHEESGYSLDLALLDADRQVCIEVDGPSHFVARGRRPLGSTLLKHRHLQAMGWTVISVPFWEWQAVAGRPRPPAGATPAAAGRGGGAHRAWTLLPGEA